MKRFPLLVIAAAGLVAFSVVAMPQEKSGGKQMDKQKSAQMMEMIEDSSVMEGMMERIAADGKMRMMMMQKMMHHVMGDTAGMMGMCKIRNQSAL